MFNECRCQCGLEANRLYRPGHDARHAGQVARAMAQAWGAGQEADQVIKRLPTPALRAKALNLAEKWTAEGRYVGEVNQCECGKKANSENPALCQGCFEAAELENSHLDGDHLPGQEEDCPLCQTLKVKVGRWDYPVQEIKWDQEGTLATVTYQGKTDGETKQIQVAADKIQN